MSIRLRLPRLPSRRARRARKIGHSRRRCLLESLEGRRLLAAGDEIAFVSFIGSGVVGGVHYDDEDILAVDQTTGEWWMYFDGSKVGAGGLDLEAMQVLPDGDILISFDKTLNVPNLGPVLDSDILRFTPTGHGSQTAGTFSIFFDGSDVDLRDVYGDIRGLTFDPDGRLVISTVATVRPQGLTTAKEDMLVLNNGVFGEQTSGQWQRYLDGSDVGLAGNYNFGSWIDDQGTINITTRFPFDLDGVVGGTNDAAACDPITLGETSQCNWSLAFDGSQFGIPDTQTIDTIQFGSFTGNEVFSQDRYYMSTAGNVKIISLRFDNEDIFYQDQRTAAWHMYFDGSDVGITTDVDAFHLMDDDSVLMSFLRTTQVPGVGTITGEDIVRFVPSSTGETTDGTFEMYLDGSDVELDPGNEDIDAIAFDSNGNLILSVAGTFTAGGVSGSDKDLFKFNADSIGENTAGTWQLYFDGEDVDLTFNSEDIVATWISPETGDIHFSTYSTVVTDGASGFRSDVLVCSPVTLGDTTDCDMSLFYEALPEGMNQGINGLHIVRGASDPEADLSVAISDSEDPVLAGDQVTYTLTVSNVGSADAENVVLTHTLPAGVSLDSATAAYTINNDVVTFNLGTIAASDGETIDLVVATSTPGLLASTATATTSSTESRLSNNTANETTEVTAPQADLSLSISDSADPVMIGDQITYTLTVRNEGPEEAENTILTTTLPASVTFIDATPSVQPDLGVLTHDLGNIAPGGEISVLVVVETTVAGAINLDASVVSDTDDVNAGNNASSESTTVTGPPSENNVLYASFVSSGTVGNVPYHDEDIVAYDTETESWLMYFDGSQLGLTAADIDAFHVRDDGKILISFNGTVTVDGLGRTEDSDILLFTPTGHGNRTAGTFDWFVDGSDVGLPTTSGDVDAISLTADGRLLISLASSPTVSGLSVRREDLLVLNNGSFGETTTGEFAIYLDGSEIGLANYNVFGASVDSASSVLMTLNASFNVDGLTGDGRDVLRYDGNALEIAIAGESLGVAAGQVFDGLQLGSFAGSEVFGQDLIYMSHVGNSLTNGLRIADEDIVVHDTSSGRWEFFFDGSDVGITTDINAFSILDDGSVLMSFNANTDVPGVGLVNSRDIVRFIPTTTGEDTEGSFECYFNGADVELTTYYEAIDAISFALDGSLVISTLGNYVVDGLSGKGADLLKFNPEAVGADTTGTWELYFDGSDVELTTSAEGIAALSIDPDTGDILFATVGTMQAAGVTATKSDIASCAPALLGDVTECTFSLHYDGSDFGSTQALDAIHVVHPPATAETTAHAKSFQGLSVSSSLVAEAEYPYKNDDLAGDVNDDGAVLASDALRIVNELSVRRYSDSATGKAADPGSMEAWPGLYYDPNGDDRITAADALLVINLLRSESVTPPPSVLASSQTSLRRTDDPNESGQASDPQPAVDLSSQPLASDFASAAQTREIESAIEDMIGLPASAEADQVPSLVDELLSTDGFIESLQAAG